MSIKVIGVGLPRTGTRTLAAAFNRLGFPCIHQLGDYWAFGPQEVDGLLLAEQFQYHHHVHLPHGDALSVTEAKYWRMLLLAYPDAAVVLTVREYNAWFASIARHCDRIHARLESTDPQRMHDADTAHQIHFGTAYPIKALWCERAICHEIAVKAWCADHDRRLLVFDCTQGEWGELPAFLGCETPEVVFPWLNRCDVGVVDARPELGGAQ